ncbi:hypothetical protein [Ruegeria sp.]|uniref:hypothetical protein n=1 Tax=Ruegeria sp. TaxID=1879320 RepID=UPI00230BA6ED|nr:hypothetical protein [Ruegeria sp.]MDA7965533.1 hypothetical protein [Ruegeria sp.]
MTDISCRDPNLVMRLARLGSMHQSRLSFMRILTRRMARENWRFEQTAFEIDAAGVGHAVYTAHGPARSYSLIAYAHDLPPEKRSDRVIAEAWDATFTLFDGVPTAEDIERLSKNIPVQEAGRVTGSELSVSRANRSVRLWEHVVSELAEGHQPSVEKIDAVGYLMRTTAVYGSGKLGAADREMIADRPEFQAPFQVEMLSVYLTRWFVTDLVQYMADTRAQSNGAQAARLAPDIARMMGIGNSTGLGMAPFLLNHPVLFNNWMAARERAIQAVRSVQRASDSEIALFHELITRSKVTVDTWKSEHPIQIEKLSALTKDVTQVTTWLDSNDLKGDHPWDALYRWAEETLSLEGQEWIASLVLEPYGPLIDAFAEGMAADNTATFRIAGAMKVGDLRSALTDIYSWALDTDWAAPENKARAWYVSEEKLEPRLGERFEEPIEEYEQPLAPGRDAAALFQALAHWPDDTQVADFLLRHPEHRHTLRRAQIVGRAPYAEIRDNTISDRVLPIDMLRCKLSFFGATKFDPRSDRWVRICMYGNAPLPYELTSENADYWVFPDTPEAAA